MGRSITNNRLRGERWRLCAVCDFEYPESQMWFRRGRWVCRDLDADENLLVEAEPMEPTDRRSTEEPVQLPEWPRK
jgi:hypothetical protein